MGESLISFVCDFGQVSFDLGEAFRLEFIDLLDIEFVDRKEDGRKVR